MQAAHGKYRVGIEPGTVTTNWRCSIYEHVERVKAARRNVVISAYLLINLQVPDVSVLITSSAAASGDTRVTRLLTAAAELSNWIILTAGAS